MGEPNATEMPAAAAADSTSLFRADSMLAGLRTCYDKKRQSPSLLFKLSNGFIIRFAQQQAT